MPVPVYSPTSAGTLCAYTQRDGQVELIRMPSYIDGLPVCSELPVPILNEPDRRTATALANRRPCSNYASESISPPLPLTAPLLPFPPFPSPFPQRSGPLETSYGVCGSAVSFPSRAPAAVAFCCIVCSQNASNCSISGSLVSIAMSGKMKANHSTSLISLCVL